MKKIFIILCSTLLLSCNTNDESTENNNLTKEVSEQTNLQLTYEDYDKLTTSLIDNFIKHLNEGTLINEELTKKTTLDLFSNEEFSKKFGINNQMINHFYNNDVPFLNTYNFSEKEFNQIDKVFSKEEKEYARLLLIALANNNESEIKNLIIKFKSDLKTNNLSNLYFSFSLLENSGLYIQNTDNKMIQPLLANKDCFREGMRGGAIGGVVGGISGALKGGLYGAAGGPAGSSVGVLGGFVSGGLWGFGTGFAKAYFDCKTNLVKKEITLEKDFSLFDTYSKINNATFI